MASDGSIPRKVVTAQDVRASTEYVIEALKHVPGDLWLQEPEGMEWSRHFTLRHCIEVFGFLSRLLANGESITSRTPRTPLDPGIEIQDLLNALPLWGEVLIRVSEASSSSTRGWHPWGSPDPEGYLAQACNEMLLHGHDITHGLEVEVHPSEDLCDRLLNRLYPWAPPEAPRWTTMLWVSGRGELEGQMRITSWKAHVAPLSEWDGKNWSTS